MSEYEQLSTAPLKSIAPFQLPFPSGSVVIVHQSNGTPDPMSHALPNCYHAVDFSGLVNEIVACADGEVVEVFSSAAPGDSRAGEGFGNFVKVRHSGGIYSFYSHLERLTACEGDSVTAGDLLGFMGNTGWAGSKHLHFSVHPEPIFSGGIVGPTQEISSLLAIEFQPEPVIRVMSSVALKDYRQDPDRRGMIYGSISAQEANRMTSGIEEALGKSLEQNKKALSAVLAELPQGEWLFRD